MSLVYFGWLFYTIYNKWFMTGDAQKWAEMMDEKEKKMYKLALGRVETNVLNEVVDVSLTDTRYQVSKITLLVHGNEIMGVEGKLYGVS